MPNLQIVIPQQNTHKPIKQHLALFLRHAINVRSMLSDSENRFPPRHGVGSNDGVDGFER